ncbi:MAG: hypothetical protein V4628_05305 [Pseudomonadota bacterium]
MEIISEHKYEDQVDAYLNNTMDAADKAAFEVLMLEDSALFERVQLVDALKQGLISDKEALVQASEATRQSSPRTTALILPFAAWVRQPMSLAASVLVAVLGVQTFYQGFLNQTGRSGALPIGSLVLVEGTRSDTSSTFTGSGPYLFQIDAGLGTKAEAFAVTLRNRVTNSPVVQEQGLQADNNGWVRVVINAELAGEYAVELTWSDDQGVTQTRSSLVDINN